MILTIMIFILFCIVLFSKNYNNKITYAFMVYMLGIISLVFSVLLYLSKFSDYSFPLKIDYSFFLILSKFRINVPDISRIYNLSIAIILFSAVLFMRIIRHIKWRTFLILLLPIIYYIWSNDPTTTFNYYIDFNTQNAQRQSIITQIINFNRIFGNIIIIAYMIMPFVMLYFYFKNTRFIIKRRYAIITSICLFLMDAFVVVFFLVSSFSRFSNANMDLLKFPAKNNDWNSYMFIAISAVFIVMLLIWILFYYRPFGNISVFTEKNIVQNSRMMNESIRMIFHVYKNIFFSIEKLAQQAIDKKKSNECITEQNLQKILNISHSSFEKIGKSISALQEKPPVHLEIINVTNCIEAALSNIAIPPNIEVIKNIVTDNISILGDKFLITESFVNLLNNAVHALVSSKKDSQYIKIVAVREDDMACLEFEDNGCGIDKKVIKNIFKPLFSLNPGSGNSGLGLAYVENVIKAHFGNIFVVSEYGKYTRFQIMIPIKERGSRNGKN